MKFDPVTRLADGFVLSGTLEEDVVRFLLQHDAKLTAAHSIHVARRAYAIAEEIGDVARGDVARATQAALLHDVSGVIPVSARIAAAQAWGVPVLPEEEAFPLIIHQKLSVVIAREIFQITDAGVLSAIGCHTTLKAAPSTLDKVVFIADKLAWDQPGQPPYLALVEDALRVSLDQAVFIYLDYVWTQRSQLRVIHPWLREAYGYFAAGQAAGETG